MRLSDRLERIAAKAAEVTEGYVADVGTDHGFVPIRLIESGKVKHVVAMDVRKGPLERACEHVGEYHMEDQIETRLSDGLKELKPGEADTVIIAGMGGELIIKILENGRHMWDSVSQWVLSPQSEIFKVRRWLLENGFEIRREDMLLEDGKYYTVMDVRRRGSGDADQAADALKGADQADGNAQDAASASGLSGLSEDSRMLYGDYLIRTKNSVLLTYLKEEEEKLARFIGDLSAKAGSSERAAERLSELKVQLRENQEVQHEMQGDH